MLVIPLTTTVITYAGTFFNVAVIILLRDPAFFNVREGEIGRVTNDIIFYSQLTQILFTLAAGYLYDILGRRVTVVATMLPGALIVMLVPTVAPSILLLIVIRIFSSFGIWTLGCHPFINDYVSKETRGRAVAIQAAGFILGDLLTFAVMLNLTRDMSPYGRFQTYGLSLILLTVLFAALIKEPTDRQVTREQHPLDRARELSRQMWELCKSDVLYPICLLGSMSARIIMFLFSTFMMLYVTSEIPDQHLAETVIQKVNIVAVLATLLIVVPAGKMADRLTARMLIPFAFTLTSVALVLFQFLPPLSRYASSTASIVPLVAIVSLIMTGSVFAATCIESLYAKNLPKDIRGVMNGLQSFAGALGGLWFTKLGGYVYDVYGPRSPFLLVAMVNIVFVVFVLWNGLSGNFRH